MRKSALIAFGLAVAMAGTAAAQAPKGDTLRGSRGDGARGERFERRGGGPNGFLLRGITLTDAQKTQLEQLRVAERQKMETSRGGMKQRAEQVREARQRGDTAAMRVEGQKRREEMQRVREQHVAAVRNILTPEQRVQFDKNVAEMKQHESEHGKHGGRDGQARGKGFRR